ncbi:MAG: tetratricopeptide repeat protein [Planctomycetales bacterium]|nr:tetratricopeptide repeat protein [Planctomycetales bacterium]
MRGAAAPMTSGRPVEPRAFLTDFGLAKAVATGSRFTRSGDALGTPAYMSPEQARGEASSLTPATDVWSLGGTLYEMLAARPPFPGESAAAIVGALLTREPRRIQRDRPDVPRALDRVLRCSLAKAARARYADAGAVRDDLDRVLRGEPPRARLPGSGRLQAAAAVLAAGLAAWVALLVLPRGEGDSPSPVSRPASSAAEALAARASGLREGDPAAAARRLAEALALEPARPAWRLELGLLLWALGDGEAARAEWGGVPREAPEGRRARLYRALEPLFQLREPGSASGADAAALGELATGGDAEARLARAALACSSSRWPETRAALGALEGWEPALLRGYVEAMDPRGDPTAAVRELSAALTAGIPFAWVYSLRGMAREAAGDLRGAEEDQTAALRLLPAFPDALTNRGTARLGQGRIADAIADHTEALRYRPRDAAALNNRANARRAAGDLRGAVADYSAALAIEPHNPEMLNNRGLARAMLGESREAFADADAAVRLRPGMAGAWNTRGLARWGLGDSAGAIEDYSAALRLEPRRPTTLLSRALARRDRGDRESALRDVEEALALDPSRATAHSNRALLLAEVGRVGEALASADRALAMDPTGAYYAHAARGLVLLREGRNAQALDEFGKFDSLAAPGDPLRRDVAVWKAEAAGGVPK